MKHELHHHYVTLSASLLSLVILHPVHTQYGCRPIWIDGFMASDPIVRSNLSIPCSFICHHPSLPPGFKAAFPPFVTSSLILSAHEFVAPGLRAPEAADAEDDAPLAASAAALALLSPVSGGQYPRSGR